MATLSATSYLRMLAHIATRGLRARGKECSLPKERLVLEQDGIHVQPYQVERYLRATEGSEIRRFAGADAVLPPLYPAIWETALALALLTDPRIPAAPGGVLHLENDALPLRPLRPADAVRCRLELERAVADPRGLSLHLLTRNWNGARQLCSENRTVLLLRGVLLAGNRPEVAARESGTGGEEGEDRQTRWEELARWSLRGSHGRRYARASGDYNPIHLWRLTALPFGFRRPVLHGFCTEALVAHALIARRWEGDPSRLRRLRIRFRAPLLLPERVALQIAETPEGARFRVVGVEGRRQGRVFAHGSFVGG